MTNTMNRYDRSDFEYYDNTRKDWSVKLGLNPTTGLSEPFRYKNTPITNHELENMFKKSHIREYVGHTNEVHGVAWNSDGRRLASGSVDKTACIWSPHRTEKRPLVELRGHTASIEQLDWDPTHPDRLATASGDRTVRLWDQRSGKCTKVIGTSDENINIYWSPDGSHIAVGDRNHTISIIDAKTHDIVHRQSAKSEVYEMAWNCANNIFFVATREGTVKVYDYPSLELKTALRGHTANCYCVDTDPAGRYIAAGSADGLVTLWDTKTFTCIRAFSELSTPVRAIGFSFDGQFIVSAAESRFIDISHVESGESVHKIESVQKANPNDQDIQPVAINAVAWHPHDYYLAYAGDDMGLNGKYVGGIRVFNVGDPFKSVPHS